MSVFDLLTQNHHLDSKITAGLERLSQVFKTLLWDKAKQQGLSPIQIQILIFIHHHSIEKSTVSYLAKEFNVTKPTISDAIKILEQKNLIEKTSDTTDTRSYTINLTDLGRTVVKETEDFPEPIAKILSQSSTNEKEILWNTLSTLIADLNRSDIISVQRICFNCKHYSKDEYHHYCNLLNIKLEQKDIRIDCPEFELN